MKILPLMLLFICALTNVTCMNTAADVLTDIKNSEIISAILYNDKLPLSPPSNLVATPLSASRVELTWDDNSTNEKGFKIERSSNSFTGFTEIATVDYDIKTYIDNQLHYNTCYYYRVKSYKDSGNSKSSNIASCTTLQKSNSWSKYFGGSGHYNAWAYSIQETKDEGFIVAGSSQSKEYGSYDDFWILKLDCNGDMVWNKIYGAENKNKTPYSIQETTDGGFIAAGASGSYDIGYDMWIMKLDKDGEKIWDRVYGGSADDIAYSTQETTDKGFIIAGTTKSFGSGGSDIWIVKLDKDGEKIWDRVYGGSADDDTRSIQETTDGGFIAAGLTSSKGAGSNDIWVMKLNRDGMVGPVYPNTWEKTFGSSESDWSYSIQQTEDGGFIVAGNKSYDAWILKLDKDGTIVWDKTYAGNDGIVTYSIQQTDDKGYIIAGCIITAANGFDGFDFWLIKLTSDGYTTWNKTYGGTKMDIPFSAKEVTGGGYIVAGVSGSYIAYQNHIWIMKLDTNGNCIGCQ